jgi:predicted chitinase
LTRGRALFDGVVRLCGISTVLAPGIVRRALLDQKVRPEDAEPRDYEAALPRLGARLTAYLSQPEADRQVRRIAAFLAQANAQSSMDEEDEADWSMLGRVIDVLKAAEVDGRPPEAQELDTRASLARTGERLRDGAKIDRDGTGD